MKNLVKLFGIIALVAVIVFSMAACGEDDPDGNGDPTSVAYTSYDDQGNKYELVINKDPNRAAYTPQTGDSFTLTVTNPAGTVIASATGTVTVNGSNFTLTKSGGGEITITISGGAIGTISGTVPGAGGNDAITNPTVTPNNPNTGGNDPFAGTWEGTTEGMTIKIVAANGNFTQFNDDTEFARGTYTFSGSTVTSKLVEINFGVLGGDNEWLTVANLTNDQKEQLGLSEAGTNIVTITGNNTVVVSGITFTRTET